MLAAGVDAGRDVVVVLFSAMTSVLTTVAVFRARLAVMDVRHLALVQQIERDRVSNKELIDVKFTQLTSEVAQLAETSSRRFDTSERLLRATLDVVASLAGRDGLVPRPHPGDVLTRYLSEKEQK